MRMPKPGVGKARLSRCLRYTVPAFVSTETTTTMATRRDGLASVSLGATKAIGLRLVAQGRFENLSQACPAGLRPMEDDGRIVDRLVALGEAGMTSGADDGFDIDAFIEEVRAGT